MIGDRIKQARLALGYSAEQVAAFLQVSPATIYRYENGDISKLPCKFIKPLAEYLCVTPAYLMGWSEDSVSLNHQLKKDEARLITAYRSASDEIKGAALAMLEDSASKNRKNPASTAG